jgi:hypothetical protein
VDSLLSKTPKGGAADERMYDWLSL